MALASAVQSVPSSLAKKEIILKVTPSGNYVAGGDTLNLSAATNPKYLVNGVFGYPGNIEDYEVLSCPTGFAAELIPGSNLTNWKLKFSETGAALSGPFAELAAAAYPAALSGGTILLRFRGPKGQL